MKGSTVQKRGGSAGAADEVALRPGRADDADVCGRICYEAFRAIAERHGFPPDFPAPEAAVGLLGSLISHPGFYAVVAEQNGKVVGSNFLDERSTIAGLGPITVDPAVQNAQIGRRLMVAVLERAKEKGFPGVRLQQAAYHNRSLSLYAKLGFEVREPCVTLQGRPVREQVAGYSVRAATESDLDACNRVCFLVHGHDRSGEVRDAIGQGTARVVEHDGRVTGYTTDMAYFAHSVGESNSDLKALIGAAEVFGGPGILLPAGNGEVYRWCLDRGLRVVHVMNLMTVGLYNEPAGAYLPSVLY
jgi:GNAT superfamily N-acetyltransferase